MGLFAVSLLVTIGRVVGGVQSVVWRRKLFVDN